MYTFSRIALNCRVRVCTILAIFGAFASSIAGQADPVNITTRSISPADEAAVKAVAEAFCDAFAKKDIVAVEKLWSPNSNSWKEVKEDYEKTFAKSGDVAVKSISIRYIAAEKDLIKLRFKIDFTTTDKKSGAPYDPFDSSDRVVLFVKGGDSWKIESHISAEKDLAHRLIAEKGQTTREQMLKDDADIVNSQLAVEIRSEGDRLQGKVPRSVRRDIYQIGLRVAEMIDDKVEVINALDMMAWQIPDRVQKLAVFQRALNLSKDIGRQDLTAQILLSIADFYYEADEYDTASDYAKTGMSAAEAAEDRRSVGIALNLLGIMEEMRGDYVSSIDYHEKALAIRREAGDQSRIAGSLTNIGLVYGNLGDNSKAIKYFGESIELYERANDKYGLALSLMNLGNVYKDNGDYPNAMDLFRRSIEADAESGGDGNQQIVSIGFAYEEQGNYDLAKVYLAKALSLVEKTDKKVSLGLVLGGLGRIERALGNYEEATKYQQRALALYTEVGYKLEIANTLQRLGAICSDRGEYNKAAGYFKDASEIYQSLSNSTGKFEILLETSKIQMRQGNFAVALKTSEEARSFYEQTDGCNQGWWIYYTLAKANRGLGQISQARENLGKSIAIIEKQRSRVAGGLDEQEMSFARMTSPYLEMADVFVSEKNLYAAFSYIEHAKARTLLDALQVGKIDLNRSMSEAERQTEQRFRDELTSLNAQIAAVLEVENPGTARRSELEKLREKKRLALEDFQVQLYAAHPGLRVQRGEMKPISIEEIASLLPDAKSAIAEYVVAGDKTFLFLITMDAAKKVSLKVFTVDIKDKELGKRVEAYREKLAAGDLDFQNASRELYDLLLKPAAAQLAGKTNLIVVPDGPLWDLPFQALQNEKNKYLVEQAAISYAPSLTALKEMSKKAKARKPDAGMELVAFGNPIVAKETSDRVKQVFMSEKLEPLPEAERLVKELGKMYGPTRSKVYTGAEAREETAKTESPKYRIVQFATHGILNNVSPMYSHLLLAQDEKDKNEDGLLEAWEMKDLDLKADMVILSACDTARGRISNGEGVIGMTWALFIAGTPTTVATQWKVESSSTTELMLEFHRQLLTGKTTKAEALRRAEVKLLKVPEYKHPSYWAGFVIVGDGN